MSFAGNFERVQGKVPPTHARSKETSSNRIHSTKVGAGEEVQSLMVALFRTCTTSSKVWD